MLILIAMQKCCPRASLVKITSSAHQGLAQSSPC